MFKRILFSLVIIVSLVSLSFAQAGQRYPGRRNLRVNRNQTFDLSNSVQIKGSVVDVVNRANGFGRFRNGLELLINTGEKTLSVRIGPKVFIESNNWQFKKGDKIQVIAYNGTGQSKGIIFAARVTMNGKTLILRDANGIAQWSFGNRGRGRGRW